MKSEGCGLNEKQVDIRESADGQKYEILIDDSGNRIERILHEQ